MDPLTDRFTCSEHQLWHNCLKSAKDIQVEPELTSFRERGLERQKSGQLSWGTKAGMIVPLLSIFSTQPVGTRGTEISAIHQPERHDSPCPSVSLRPHLPCSPGQNCFKQLFYKSSLPWLMSHMFLKSLSGPQTPNKQQRASVCPVLVAKWSQDWHK